MLDGLQERTAQIKHDEASLSGDLFRLEVHKRQDGSVWIVGYVHPAQDPLDDTSVTSCDLFMRKDRRRSRWTSVPVDQIDLERSHAYPIYLHLVLKQDRCMA